MPVKSTGTATISFGLVSVPVHIYSSSESRASVSFNMLHKKCGTRVKQQYICPKDNNEVVSRDEMVKGYEFAKDQYVTFTPDELKALEEKATGTIDINEFVPLAEVDREYVEKIYYLGPDKGGDRAYRLLAKALQETSRAALGQFASRGQQYLVLLRPNKGVIVMEQLHYADEMKSPTEVPIPEGDVKETELKLAKQLIDQGTTETFEPAKYKDTVRERVLEAIQGKVDGQEITAEPSEKGGAKIIDLMEALKASLAAGAGGDEDEEEEPKKKKARKAS
jgi:DNA end-binding protein Ku